MNDDDEEEEVADAMNGIVEAEQSDEDEEEESESEQDEPSESENEDDEDDAEVDPEFRRQVAEALQVNGMAAADGSDSDSEDEVVLDDDQMMQLDEHLAKVFKAQAGNTKEKKGAHIRTP